jgi:sterol desaturase/sphingolipid hydroxylase (fatty acid hydroxylase superfamily)
MAADWARAHNIGLLSQWRLSPVSSLLLGVLLRSFISFYTHWLMHKIPWFWRVHRVHHADTQLDVSTTVRFHPLEPAIALPCALLGIVAFGVDPVAVLLYELLDATITVWSHANVRWPTWLARVIGTVLVTPDQHRVHHHPQLPWTDSNFGATFNIWDRLFGTFRTAPRSWPRPSQIGLPDIDAKLSQSLRAQLALPWHRFRSRPSY